MKLAALFTDGSLQLVATPQTDEEKALIALLGRETQTLKVQAFRGGFYECRGGWSRESYSDDSLIIRIE